jgi:hypothetical protein
MSDSPAVLSSTDCDAIRGATPLGEGEQTFLPASFPSSTTAGQPRSGTPPLSTGSQQLTIYQKQKREGLRRSNGALKLKKLNNRHLDIISRHLQGESGEQISTTLGITIITVSRVLNDPLAKEFLSKIYEDRQGEIDALAGAAIDVVRDGLRGQHSLREKLTAVDKYSKLKETIGKKGAETQTAEDVVQRMLESLTITDSNVQINLGDKK